MASRRDDAIEWESSARADGESASAGLSRPSGGGGGGRPARLRGPRTSIVCRCFFFTDCDGVRLGRLDDSIHSIRRVSAVALFVLGRVLPAVFPSKLSKKNQVDFSLSF